MSSTDVKETALVVGVGPGLGASLARRFAAAGMRVALAARDEARLGALAEALAREGADARVFGCDASEERAVATLFERLERELGTPALCVYNAGAYLPARVTDISTEDFVRCWQVGCLGGFLVGREAARRMSVRGSGTIIFTGATASLRGGAGFANLAVGKFGLRALAQSMARELGPTGVHVAHVIIDGQIHTPRYEELAKTRGPDALLSPDAIADEYYRLHRQHRSAWTFELDLRPWVEKF